MKEIYGLNLGVFYSRINDLVNYWKEGDIENNKIAKEMFDVMLKAGIGINDGMFINNNSDALHRPKRKMRQPFYKKIKNLSVSLFGDVKAPLKGVILFDDYNLL